MTVQGRRIPSPCCSWCGHEPHAGPCRGCPCARNGAPSLVLGRTRGTPKAEHATPGRP